MKTAIVGIGGGGYYGGLLAKKYANDKNVEIVFIARNNHLDQIHKNGLKLITTAETYTGYIVREAGKFGLSVPTYEKVYTALKKQLHG